MCQETSIVNGLQQNKLYCFKVVQFYITRLLEKVIIITVIHLYMVVTNSSVLGTLTWLLSKQNLFIVLLGFHPFFLSFADLEFLLF